MAGVVIVALNPARQFAQARNTQRWSNINTILNAVAQRMADNRGVWDSNCKTSTVNLPSTATNIGANSGLVNLEACLVSEYIAGMVVDPLNGTTADTNYSIVQSEKGKITISAPTAELGEAIAVSR